MGDNVLSYKALPLLGRNICHCPNVWESCGQFICTNLLDSYYLKTFFSEASLDISTSSFVYNFVAIPQETTPTTLCFAVIVIKIYPHLKQKS